MNNNKNKALNPALKSIISSLICIVIGLLVGLVVMMVIAALSEDISFDGAFQALSYLIKGPFSSKIVANQKANLGNLIFYAVPLIFTGLSVGIAYKTGLFNIGAPGQFVMGTIGSLTVALSLHSSSATGAFFIWLLALLFGTLLGALWGIIPGSLKAFFGINEVIASIMTNWIAANISTWYFTSRPDLLSSDTSKSASFTEKVGMNHTPTLGLDKVLPNSLIDGGIIFAIIVAVIVVIVMNKTTFGYELKACGLNKDASKYAGLNEKRNIILSMAIAGGLAGMGACFYYLNPGIEYKYNTAYSALPDYGFNGIASSFLASCNPVGTIFSSLFIRWLNIGGEYLINVGFNRYIADLIIAVIIYLAGFTKITGEVIDRIRGKLKKKNEVSSDDEKKA